MRGRVAAAAGVVVAAMACWAGVMLGCGGRSWGFPAGVWGIVCSCVAEMHDLTVLRACRAEQQLLV